MSYMILPRHHLRFTFSVLLPSLHLSLSLFPSPSPLPFSPLPFSFLPSLLLAFPLLPPLLLFLSSLLLSSNTFDLQQQGQQTPIFAQEESREN